MSVFLLTLFSTLLISICSLSGIFLLFFREHLLKQISLFLVALAAGALMGVALLDLLPETIEQMEGVGKKGFLVILVGFTIFFLIEKVLHWHHSHRNSGEHSSLGVLSMFGDSLHNFFDGMIIAATFFIDAKLGFATVAAVALHEIPQEIAEFGVLLYAGFSKYRALALNFLSASSVIAGGLVSYFIGGIFRDWIVYFLFFAVGTFLYLGASDFVPEIRKEEGLKRSLQLLFVFVCGIVLIWLFTLVE
ncbi:MAG: ZIP family metal transporter [Candidatus Wildermuthbacteria bacterium]|nr:ZIP family metal transporter [Candidatus Wildermuthbacteria bacterium]